MSYIDGIVAPVPAGTTREEYRAFAELSAAVFRDAGAIRVVDAWADDVPHGQTTDFYRAVAAEEGEALVFGWVEWPDKDARDRGMAAAMADPRMQPGTTPMPMVGKRMIFGGFAVVHDSGEQA